MRRIATVVAAVILTLSLAACGAGGGGGTVKVAAQNWTEQIVLGEIVKQTIEANTKYKVELVGGLGSTATVHQALVANEAQVAAGRYVGTDLTGTLKVKEAIRDPKEAMAKVQSEFTKQFDQTWFDSYGFENSYIFAVTQDTAKQHGLKNTSDLMKVAKDMNAGVDNSWLERPGDGYDAFKKHYGFAFKKATPMDIGLVYKAVADNKMDVVLAYSTDARIKQFNLAILPDDKHFFPPYQTSMVARNDALKQFPQLKGALEKLAGKISTAEMTNLNFQVDVEKKDAALVAKDFLKSKGLVK